VVALLLPNAWIIFTAAGLVIVVGIPSLAICNMVIHTRMKQAEDGLNEHIRGRSIVASSPSDSSVHGTKQKEYIPNTDMDVCKPLLNDSETGALITDSSTFNNNNTSNDVTASSPTTISNLRTSWYSQLTQHNFNILLIRFLAMSNMVAITSVDTNVVYHKHQLALQQAASGGASDFLTENNAESVSPTIY